MGNLKMAPKRKRSESGKVSRAASEFLAQISEIENKLRKALAVKDRELSKVQEEKHQRETELAELYDRIEVECRKWKQTINSERNKHSDHLREKNNELEVLRIENERRVFEQKKLFEKIDEIENKKHVEMLHQKESQLEAMEKENKALINENMEKSTEIKILIQTLKQEKEWYNGMVQEKLCLEENIRNEKTQLVSAMESLNDKNRELREEVESVTQQANEKTKLLEEKNKELYHANKIIDDVKKELVEGDTNNKADLKDHAEIDVLLLAKQRQLTQKKYKKIKKKLANLKTKANSQNSKFKEVKKKMIADDVTIETLRVNYNDAIQKLKEKEKEAVEKETNYAQMEEKVNESDARLQSLLNEKVKVLSDKDKQIEDLKQESKLSEQKNKTLIDEYQTEISNIKKLLSKCGLPPPPPPPPTSPHPACEHPPPLPPAGDGLPAENNTVGKYDPITESKQAFWERKPAGYLGCPKCSIDVKHVNIFRHLIQVHEKSSMSLPCGECKDAKISQSNISNHISWLHETQTYPCSRCGHRFISYLYLKQHEKIVHGPMFSLPFGSFN